ncbi:GIY-YIG nuclease family protein [Desulfuromusa kysingii]|uniref:GIY-YIG nuclease family protein n=1 Tax=Desulfuromusa kysingii TaxID=37625 RepID=UPI000A68F9A1|nr:GIY-YIG nuclease family protein [Desulfuromusa kysingii]
MTLLLAHNVPFWVREVAEVYVAGFLCKPMSMVLIPFACYREKRLQIDRQQRKVMMHKHWHVYMILCSDDSLYTGITTDVQRRFDQHVAGAGAKYFRRCSPQQVVYLETGHNRSSASRREAQIKKLTREHKKDLIASSNNKIKAINGMER